MIISFSGPSGAGKSTIIAQMVKNPVFKGRKVIVKNEDNFVTINLAKRLLGENIFSRYKDEWYYQKKYSDIFYKLFRELSRVFYPLVVWTEFYIIYIKYQVILTKNVLLVDKFIFDHEVNFRTLMGLDNPSFVWFYNHFPRLYLSFLISIDLKNAATKRNKNNVPGKVTSTRQYHKEVLDHFHRIAEKHRLIVIENNSDLAGSIREITKHIQNKEKLLNTGRIALCGLDGAGKTTLANMLVKYADSLNVKCTVAHFINNNLLYKLLLRLGYYSYKSEDLMYEKKREQSSRERIKQTPFIMAFLRYFDSYLQYLFYITVYRNNLLIFDRYFYDYLVNFEYLKITNRSFFNKLVPDIQNKFLLQPRPMTSYKRKPERVKKFFLECHKIFSIIADKWGIIIINTENKDPEYAFRQLINNIQ